MIEPSVVNAVQLCIFDLNGYMRCYTRMQMMHLVSAILCGDSNEVVAKNYAPFRELLTSVARDSQSYYEGLRMCEHPAGLTSAKELALVGDIPAFNYALDAMAAQDKLIERRKTVILGYLDKIECHRKYYPVIEKNRQTLLDIAASDNIDDTLEAMRILTLSWESDPGQGVETMRTRSVLSTMREENAALFSSYARKMFTDFGYIETFEFLRARMQGEIAPR